MQTIVVDVNTVIPRERHPRIFKAWNSLAAGTAMIVVNDHDPVPLYYQFAAEYCGEFHWEYLEQGPDKWRVRICKGNYGNPGFLPRQRSASSRETAATSVKEALVLDVRPIFAQGGSPCAMIDAAVANLTPGQSFVLIAPFEPVPLFGKLGTRGFGHRSEAMVDGSWRIEFTPGTKRNSGTDVTPSSCSCC